MIQELLGEATAGLIGQERSKFSVPAGVSPSPPSSSTTTTAPTSSSTTSENLRCPRCDSTNTKFCYYNNYNLTQPRHFCKTCRRYWTKGGALRNVPIGGGCRKNKSTSSGLTSSPLSSAANYNKSNNNNNNTVAKLKTTISAELGRSSFISSNFMDHELISSNPILFASPQNSHLLSLLRTNSSSPNPNPNLSPLSNSTTIKDEPVLLQSHLSSGPPPAAVTLNARILGLDPLCPFPSVWRTSNQQQNGGVVGELQQSSGILDFYQRLRSSTTSNYYQDNAPPPAAASSSSSTSTVLESAPVVGGATELGFWTNPVLSWSDLPTTHGAYP